MIVSDFAAVVTAEFEDYHEDGVVVEMHRYGQDYMSGLNLDLNDEAAVLEMGGADIIIFKRTTQYAGRDAFFVHEIGARADKEFRFLSAALAYVHNHLATWGNRQQEGKDAESIHCYAMGREVA